MFTATVEKVNGGVLVVSGESEVDALAFAWECIRTYGIAFRRIVTAQD